MSEPQKPENETNAAEGAVDAAHPPADEAVAEDVLNGANFDEPAAGQSPDAADVSSFNLTQDPGAADTSPADEATEPVADDPSGAMGQASIDDLLKDASFEEPAAVGAAAPPDTSSFNLPDFQQAMRDAQVSSIDLLRDVDLNVKIELGRSRMLVEDVLKLAEGSVVELDKLAGDPVDVFVNDRLVARGEVLVLNDNFCVRINEIMAGVKEEGT